MNPPAPAVDSPSVWLGTVKLPTDVASLMKARSWAEAGTTIVPAIFAMIFFVSILLSLALIVRAGLMFVLSEGSKENFVKARTALTQALVGLVLVLCVFLIFNAIQLLLGVNLTGNLFFGGCYWGGTCPVPPGGAGP